MYVVSAGYPDTYMIPGTRYVLCTRYVCTWYQPATQIRMYLVSAGRRTFRPWTHTSDDSYMYQLSLVVATATVSFERSEFLIATSKKKKLCVCACVRLILVLVGNVLCTRYVCTTLYDTRYVLCTRYVWYQVRIMYQIRMIPLTYCIAICLFVSGWWYAWYLHCAQETAVSLFVYSLVGGGITWTFRPWTHTSDDSYTYQLSLVVATATVSFHVSLV